MQYRVDASAEVAANGYGWLNGAELDLNPEEARGLKDLAPLWDDLVLDPYLKVEGTTRLRRYSRYGLSVEPERIVRLPHQPFSQGEEHNVLFGDQEREFEPCPPELDENPYFRGLAGFMLQTLPYTNSRWHMRTHMVRTLVSGDASALPSPEGVHRDGYDFIALHMIGRIGVTGGETMVYESGREVATGTLINPGDGLILDDQRFTHDASPILVTGGNNNGTRDVFLFGFERADA
jgi:hypothetical protein